MGLRPKRYVFVDYESLKNIKVSKLDKVCSKVFIFISEDEERIPSKLVIQAQQMGKRIKWIYSDESKEAGFNYQISFLMGALHQKMKSNIEFAILSDDEEYDSLVNFINNTGRNCLRVKTQKDKDEMSDDDLFKGILIEDSILDEEENIPEPISKFKS